MVAQMARKQAEALLDAVAGSPLVVSLARAASKKRLRILAYHDVPDPVAFRRHMELIANHYVPVSGAEVAAALARDKGLADRAVWVTFDDGHPNVVDNALPVLREFGIKATLFVCPGVIDSTIPFWWQVVEQASALGLNPGSTTMVGSLKSLPDPERRHEVRRLAELIQETTGIPPTFRQVTSSELRAFVEAGGEVANHTWDHPLLNRCATEEQRRQIQEADEWLRASGLGAAPYFAYPNGNATVYSAGLLREMGITIATLFDHRLARIDRDPINLSRLRTNATEPLPRFRAIVSGVHPAIHALRGRLG